jgi:hypothetical protein
MFDFTYIGVKINFRSLKLILTCQILRFLYGKIDFFFSKILLETKNRIILNLEFIFTHKFIIVQSLYLPLSALSNVIGKALITVS